MSTRSGRPYNQERQLAEAVQELTKQVAALNQKVDIVWDRIFPEQRQEGDVPEPAENSDVPFVEEPDVEAFSPGVFPPQRNPRGPRAPPPNNPRMGINFVRRVLTGCKQQEHVEEDWRRTNIFHTRVEHADKSLNLIIDNGSCMNIISEHVLEKLKLKPVPHPKPYRVSWIEDSSIPVRQRCLINFSLGKDFKDEVWCDVLPMKACHLLLGRPWLYDRSVNYDGRSNCYSLYCTNKKIVLKPLRITDFTSENLIIQRVLSMRKFEACSQESGVMYALVSREVGTEISEVVPSDFTFILDDFSDVIPEDLPKELPPMRDIQHAIDLVPGSSLPNLPAYRLNPREHEELIQAGAGELGSSFKNKGRERERSGSHPRQYLPSAFSHLNLTLGQPP